MRTGWELRSIRPENAGCQNAVLNANLKFREGDLFFSSITNWTSGCEGQWKEKQFKIGTRNHFSIQIICRYELLQGWRRNRIIRKKNRKTKQKNPQNWCHTELDYWLFISYGYEANCQSEPSWPYIALAALSRIKPVLTNWGFIPHGRNLWAA